MVILLFVLTITAINAAKIDFSSFFTEFLEEGQICQFKQNGSFGICTNANDCPQIQYEFVKLQIEPTSCSHNETYSLYCCSVETEDEGSRIVQNKWKSKEKCDDIYSKPIQRKARPGYYHITIVGGLVTDPGDYPHMAALGWTNEENQINWRCGGTLISHDYVMTAAHCTVGRTPPDIIRIGAKDLINVDTVFAPQDFGIEKIIPHPDYRAAHLYNDIALIKLNQRAEITIKVRPACLWQGSGINFTDATATGYGNTEFGGKSSNELLKVDLKVLSNKECSKGYESEGSLENGIIESQLCAGDSTGEKDTCQGDSGGPIQVSTMNERQLVYHIIGVTSFGKACATTLPGVYTRVSYYLDWIESIVWD